MIRIGAVTLDTSHPLAFAKVLEHDDRAKYVGVFDDSFRSDQEVANFVSRFGLEKRCTSLDELADMCDIGFVHSCNWDRHLAYAEPFVRKGKPVFIDKPIVGTLRDCEQVAAWVRQGAVILGSSSVRYCQEISAFLAKPVAERGEIVSIYGTSGVDEFNYGIHVVEGIGALAGKMARSVRYIGQAEQQGKRSEAYYVSYGDGLNALYHTFSGCWQPFAFTIMTTKSTHAFTVDTSKLYAALLDEIFQFMEGKTHKLAPLDVLLDSVKIMLAGRISRENGGQTVPLDAIPADDPGYDGALFYAGYSANAKLLYT
ncbi:MAG: Gfo/Idh/MocA family oxidoreductase [Clostridiaceae bacterium]|nr:Gfo/Idh/MocA family oxidoreductase [Clostridiaceae bacterium]